MTKQEELDIFVQRAEDLINGQYIVADIKIVNLLKAIASSETLIAVFKNCLKDFDYDTAKRKYLVKKEYLSEDRGEFIMPTSSKELLAFVFSLLMDMDSKRIDIGVFIKKYFSEDGSFSSGFTSFAENMIKPFLSSVKLIMGNVIEGKLQDPIEAVVEAEERSLKEEEEKKKLKKLEEDDALKNYAESLKEMKQILTDDKISIKVSKLKEDEKNELTLIVDMLANAITLSDKDGVKYAYVAYKYAVKAHKHLFGKRNKRTLSLIGDIINGL